MADEDEVKTKGNAAKKGGLVGPLLGMIVVLLIGAGLGVFVAGMFKSDPVDEEVTTEEQSGSAAALGDKELWDKTESIVFEDNIANVSGEQNRYIKCTVDIRVLRDPDLPLIDKEPVKNLLREQILVELRSYNKTELEGLHIIQNIQSGLKDKMNRELRKILSPGSDTKYIKKVIVSALIKQ